MTAGTETGTGTVVIHRAAPRIWGKAFCGAKGLDDKAITVDDQAVTCKACRVKLGLEEDEESQ